MLSMHLATNLVSSSNARNITLLTPAYLASKPSCRNVGTTLPTVFRMDRSRGSVDIDSPPAVGFEALQSRLLTWLRAQAPRDRLADMLAFAVQEDYALSRGPLPGGDPMSDCLEMTHVCFPSSWRPVQKVGSNFSDVHRPVVHNAPLLKAHRSLVKAMIEKGPFVRYAWGVHLDGMLCRNPVFAPQIPEPIDPSPEEAAACSWFRVERQTMMPMPHLNRGLFTIRTYTQPLTKVVTTDDRRQRLASALRSMDEAALRYKHLRQRRDPLVRWLESGVTEP